MDKALVTFSPAWNVLLRTRTGFDGLLMSDGLLMLKNYADRGPLAGGVPTTGFAGLDETAAWAARAILAGHDMVIVEGSAAQTVRVYEGLLAAACGPSAQGAALRARMEESIARIARWKEERREPLRRVVEVPLSSMQLLIQRSLPTAPTSPRSASIPLRLRGWSRGWRPRRFPVTRRVIPSLPCPRRMSGSSFLSPSSCP